MGLLQEVRLDLVIIRAIFIVLVAIACFFLQPFPVLHPATDAAFGAILGAAVVIFELRLRAVSLKRLIGSAIGSILGIFGAYLFTLVIHNSLSAGKLQSFL